MPYKKQYIIIFFTLLSPSILVQILNLLVISYNLLVIQFSLIPTILFLLKKHSRAIFINSLTLYLLSKPLLYNLIYIYTFLILSYSATHPLFYLQLYFSIFRFFQNCRSHHCVIRCIFQPNRDFGVNYSLIEIKLSE